MSGLETAEAGPRSEPLVLPFEGISWADLSRVGGKGKNLGELARAGLPVPPGFAVTTAAFDAFLAGSSDLDAAYAVLDALDGQDAGAARRAAESMRALLEHLPVPPAVQSAVLEAWRALSPDAAWAVRSSATAEDLPGASFAGQQDTFLNVRGEPALLDAVRRCWVSLYTDRAVLYRARNGFGHRGVKLSVVVQRMVLPEVSGILFTADPVSGRRDIVSIDAGFGLGEALVSGLVNADLYQVDKTSGALLDVRVGDKALAIRPLPEGGTWQEPLSEALRRARVLDDPTVQVLVALGRRIEAHYGEPQDIEWCIEGGQAFIVQARPITSLYPLPEPPPPPDGLHVYASFGHFQMMTDVLPPLSIQIWQLLLSFQKPPGDAEPRDSAAVVSAGSRIFLDLTRVLRHPIFGRVLPVIVAHVYADLGQGLIAASARPGFSRRDGWASTRPIASFVVPVVLRLLHRLVLGDPERARWEVERFGDSVVAEMQRRIEGAAPGAARLREARRVLVETFPRVLSLVPPVIASGIIAQRLLVASSERGWLAASTDDLSALERGLPGNVTTEMDLAVADLADRARPYPGLVELLRSRAPGEALSLARELPGGPAFLDAWHGFMHRYGMRGPGEIDLARPRYLDQPAPLVGAILGGLESGAAVHASGRHRARHAALARDAEAAADRIDRAARRGWLGALRASVVSRLVRVARAGSALREHPKFVLVRILSSVRAGVREAGAQLVARGALASVDDVYLFRFDELIEALEADSPPDLRPAAAERRAQLALDARRFPPLVMASDGGIPALTARTDVPENALPGTPASSGVAVGIARVVLDPARGALEKGEILVAPHTDPGWTPLFVHAAALVTEVGGLMTHGSVIAREYGIPAVVSVNGATQRIRTGQRIRVDGTRGFVELL
jgi:phosphohistidine swiveling domain-containing protein